MTTDQEAPRRSFVIRKVRQYAFADAAWTFLTLATVLIMVGHSDWGTWQARILSLGGVATALGNAFKSPPPETE